MNKTRVDDLIIEMIAPQVKNIEERFSRGEGLSQGDINTLLLKAQFNHINHLDQRLDRVADSVQALEVKFIALEAKFTALEAKFHQFEAVVTAKLDAFAAQMAAQAAITDAKIERAINTNMRWSIGIIGLIVTVLKLADMFL